MWYKTVWFELFFRILNENVWYIVTIKRSVSCRFLTLCAHWTNTNVFEIGTLNNLNVDFLCQMTIIILVERITGK